MPLSAQACVYWSWVASRQCSEGLLGEGRTWDATNEYQLFPWQRHRTKKPSHHDQCLGGSGSVGQERRSLPHRSRGDQAARSTGRKQNSPSSPVVGSEFHDAASKRWLPNLIFRRGRATAKRLTESHSRESCIHRVASRSCRSLVCCTQLLPLA